MSVCNTKQHMSLHTNVFKVQNTLVNDEQWLICESKEGKHELPMSNLDLKNIWVERLMTVL